MMMLKTIKQTIKTKFKIKYNNNNSQMMTFLIYKLKIILKLKNNEI